MADNPTTTENPEPQGEGNEPIDYEAKYHEAVAQSRKWEDRAKASFKDSEELKKLKESQMSDAEKTAKRIAELEKENAAYKTAAQQREWKAKVSKETGVPAEVLRGDSEEEIKAHAEALKALIHPAHKLPEIKDPARQPSGPIAGDETRGYIASLFGTDKD